MDQCIFFVSHSCFSRGELGEDEGLKVVYLLCPMGMDSGLSKAPSSFCVQETESLGTLSHMAGTALVPSRQLLWAMELRG